MLQMFPLLAISLIVYAVLTLSQVADVPTAVGVGETGTERWFDIVFVTLPMYSDDEWAITWGDVFLVGSMGLLFVELIRATQTATASLINHGLSFTLFIIVLLAFILAPGFGNSVFFIYLCMTLLDPMAGFIVTTVTARRDFAVTEGVGR
ncbi:MAG: hypothetical protein AAGC56_04450 [Pseudomonadota bacterium]